MFQKVRMKSIYFLLFQIAVTVHVMAISNHSEEQVVNPSRVHFYSYISSKYEDMIPHFLDYYFRYLKIKPKNAHLVLHLDGDEKQESMLQNFRPYPGLEDNLQMVSRFQYSEKTRLANEVLKKIPTGDWLIYPDLDEFFVYPGNSPNPLFEFLSQCEQGGYNVVMSDMVDRTTPNFELVAVRRHPSVWQQFPHRLDGLNAVMRRKNSYIRWLFKVAALRQHGDEGISYSGPHKIHTTKNTRRYPSVLEAHHFRLDKSLFERMELRVKRKDTEAVKIYETEYSLMEKHQNGSIYFGLDHLDLLSTRRALVLY